MCIDFDRWSYSLFLSPKIITLGHRYFSTWILPNFLLFKSVWIILVNIFVWATLTSHHLISFIWSVTTVIRILALSCSVEAFENEVCKLTLHETLIDIFQNAGGFRLNYANIVDPTRWNSDYFFVHKWFHKLRDLFSLFNSIIVWTVKWWRRHERSSDLDLVLIVAATRAVTWRWLSRASRFETRKKVSASIKRICNPWKANFFVRASPLFFNVIRELTKLAATVSSKAVKMTWFG